MKSPLKIAIIQENPNQGSLAECLEKTVGWIEEAAAEGAKLIVFGETWLTGYPAWIDHCSDVGLWDHPPVKKVFSKMYQNGVEVPGKETEILSELARKYKIALVIGINEVVKSGPGNGTIYNGMLIFDEEGRLANHHRKLMPTYTERLIYGTGDANGLQSVSTSFGQLGGLICWEHWMPHTRQAMHECGETIHIALWPNVHEMLQIASRSYAFEGRTFVIAVGQIFRVKDLPAELSIPEHLKKDPEKLLLNGGSCVIGPDGKYLLDPQYDVSGILYFEIPDLTRVFEEKMNLDTTGHYNRRDIFDFKVDKKRI